MRPYLRPYLIVLLLAMLAACSKPMVKETVPEKPVAPEPVVEVPQEENLYAQHYVARQLHGVKLSPGSAEPTIYKGVRETDDYQRMLNDGYEMLGYSSFEAGDVPPSRAVAHASKVQADAVVVYTKLIAAPTAAMRMQKIKEQAKTQASAGGSGEFYSYFATYWAKLAPPALGVHVMQRSKYDPGPGVTVLAVITGSPAAQAGVAVGDVLLSLGGEALSSAQVLQQATHRHAGQEVELVLRRVNAEKRLRVTLGAAL